MKNDYEVIPASDDPLSAEVFVIKGNDYLYLFDCGNGESALKAINSFTQKKRIIVSHFHADHFGNRDKINAEYLISRFDRKYLRCDTYEIIEDKKEIIDGVDLLITAVPSTHAKGSLILTLNHTYTFLGDSAYGARVNGKVVYNAQLLEQQIRVLKGLPTVYFINSHSSGEPREKAAVIDELEKIYKLRKKNNPFIEPE